MFDTPPSPRRSRSSWLAALAVGALFVLALVTIGLQSRVAQLRYQVAHLADRHRLWQEHVQAEQVELDRLCTPPRLRHALGARHETIEVSLFPKLDPAGREPLD